MDSRRLVALTVICAGLAGCGQQAAGLPAAGAGLPFPDDRRAAGVTEYVQQGSAPEAAGPGAQPQGSALLLDASGGPGSRWATYRFNPGGEPPDSVSVILKQPDTTQAYFGLANFASQRWELHGPYTAQKSLTIDGSDYVSPLGNIWVAVIAAPGESATVSGVLLRTLQNLPPDAALAANPPGSQPPGTPVQLDASGSSDLDGSVVQYEWDVDGLPGFEVNTGGAATLDITAPGSPGASTVAVRVTDDEGAAAEASLPLVAQGWDVQPLPGIPTGTSAFDIAIVDGRPAVAYAVNTLDLINPPPFGSDDGTLYYITADDANPTGWSAPLAIDADGAIKDVALAVVDGRPAVAYCLDTNSSFIATVDQVRFSRAGDAAGGSWPGYVVVDPLTPRGNCLDLKLVDGQPAIAYIDEGAQDLLYSRALDAQGAAWGGPVLLDDLASSYSEPCLEVVAGRPMVALAGVVGGWYCLRFVAATDAQGAAWNPAILLDQVAASNAGLYPSLAEVNGRPAVAYRSDAPGAVQFLRANDAAGSSWPAVPASVDNNNANYAQLSVVNGLPVLAYCVFAPTGKMLYRTASDADATAWGLPEEVDTADTPGQYGELAFFGDEPALVYYVLGTATLRYARKYN